MKNIENKVQELYDRIFIRELIDNYAFYADTRDAQKQADLFLDNARFIVFMDSKSPTPTQEITNKADLMAVFDNLKTYYTTMHLNGQSKLEINGNKASGISYCFAHHLSVTDSQQKFMIAAIRYLDTFDKHNGQWFFSERKLLVDWIENK